MQAEDIAGQLGGKPNGRGFLCRCPAHDDKSPSLSVMDADSGNVLIKCFAGCSTEDVVAALGIQMKDLFPPSDYTPQQRKTYRQKASRAQLLKALYHELLVLLQVVEKRVCGAMLARDKNYMKANPQFKPMPPEWWSRELAAAKRVKRVMGDLYGN